MTRYEELFARFREQLPELPVSELQSLARTAAAAEQRPPTAARRRLSTPQRLAFAIAAASALVLSGAFVGSYLAPSSTAGTSVSGLGFLPAQDWTVVQSGIARSGVASAIATNVPLHPDDELDGRIPERTLRSLPTGGVLIYTRFSARGDAAVDAAFPMRPLPLRLGAALARSEHRLRVGHGTSNVDARIFFGTSRPPEAVVGAAQRQLDRLVVAGVRVTIFSRKVTGQPGTRFDLFGAVDNNRAGERVEVQAKDCGSRSFRIVRAATTEDGGNWSTQYFPQMNTTLRAVWKGAASRGIQAPVPASIFLTQPAARVYAVAIGSPGQFTRKSLVVQRLDRKLGTWKDIKRVRLTSADGRRPTRFQVNVPRATMLRAFMPLSEARPCYVQGYSNTVRTY